MTVKELIEKLKEMPQELEVLYTENKHMGHHVGGIEKVEVIELFAGQRVIIGDYDE